MIVERSKYEKPGVTQLMYVGDGVERPALSMGTLVVAVVALWLLLKKK